MSDTEKIQQFENQTIRTIWKEDEEKWYFVVEDVIEALTESKDPKQYVKRLKLRDPELAKGWVQIVPLLSVMTEGGPQKMRCANMACSESSSPSPQRRLSPSSAGWQL